MKNVIISTLKEKTTWIGLIALAAVVATSFGALEPEVLLTIIASLWGLDEVILRRG